MPRTSAKSSQDLLNRLGLNNLVEQFSQGLVPERPWDSIQDFCMHPSYLGQTFYPKQLTLLKLIYLETENMSAFDVDTIEGWRQSFGKVPSFGVQADIWERVKYLKDNGYRRFPHIQAVLGRRASKGLIGGVLGSEAVAYMVALDNPQAYYGIRQDKDLYLQCIATNLNQAKQYQFADVRAAIEQCKYLERYILSSKDHLIHLQTPSDLRTIAERLARRIPIDHEIASIRCVAMTSTSSSGRGAASFALYFDEMAHMTVGTAGPRSSETVYAAYHPSLQQFDKDGLAFVPSSPFTRIGKFFELYTQGSVLVPEYDAENEVSGYSKLMARDIPEDPEETFVDLTSDPTMLILQGPSWMLYDEWQQAPILYPGVSFKRGVIEYNDGLKRIERRDTSKFKVEYLGQFC